MRIALLDHEHSESKLLTDALTAAGHVCQLFTEGKELLQQLRRDSTELLILQWQTPDDGSADALRWVREHVPFRLPVLLIANHADEDAIIAGRALGADDYLVRPLRRAELLVRVQVLLRHAYPTQNVNEQLASGAYVFDPRAARLCINGQAIELTQKEFDLALLFFRNLDRPLSRAFILEAVWGHEPQPASRTMDTHVSRVRSKLALRPEHGFRLVPVYSYGYRLEKLAA